MAQKFQNNPVMRQEITEKIYSDSSGEKDNASKDVSESTSLTSLIIWNVTKALELNPKMDIKHSIKAAQACFEGDDVKSIIPEYPEERHLACALLAWQQLGHSHTDSLCAFIENQLNSNRTKNIPESIDKDIENSKQQLKSFTSPKKNLVNIDCYSMGPVIKLPIEPKIVMRLDNTCNSRQPPRKPRGSEKETLSKIEAACCLDSVCAERLTVMDAATTELRTRAAKLARREAERVELLERAETAWKDLELGYQRRLTLYQEKEDDLTKQIKKQIEERNGHKNACMTLAKKLKEETDLAEKARARLSQVEKQVICERPCLRQRLSEEYARTEATLTELQCKAAQFDRDHVFKEEQARRKMLNIEGQLDSARTLTYEAERAMRAELAALKDQVSEVSKQLLEEDSQTKSIKELLAEMRQEKMNMIEDLEGCKKVCDGNMQNATNELNKKRQQLVELKEKVMECRCKLPVDAIVEVKRTPSLAALCRCIAEDEILDACSCTSIRSRLLNNLLSDLFGGLQMELGESSSAEMPCQLLKCLEDKHNWDRASIVKTNLKNYFSHLLLGELDIAIANSIEKYHARWVGETCAGTKKTTPDPNESNSEEGWQERAIEKRAQMLATELAELLFQQRTEQQVKESVDKEGPPSECKPANTDAAVYPCIVKTVPKLDLGLKTPPPPWREALNDVTQLRIQIEDLKKESIKKQDLKQMELKIAKIVKQASCTENNRIDKSSSLDRNVFRRDQKFNRGYNSTASQNKYCLFKKNPVESINKKGNKLSPAHNAANLVNDRNLKPKKFGQIYTTNTCIYSQKETSKLIQQNKILTNIPSDGNRKPTCFIVNNVITSKHIEGTLQSKNLNPRKNTCQNVCFHRVPSNTSIDKLLETLAKWKTDQDKYENKEIIKRQSELIPCQCPATKKRSSTNLKKRKKSVKKHDCLNLGSRNSSMDSLKSKRSTTTSLRSTRCKKEETSGCKLKSCTSSIAKLKKKTPSVCSIKSCKSNEKTSRNVSHNNDKLSSKPTVSIRKVESEYMGAINLDKSNENICKCSNQKDETKLNVNSPLVADNPFKCITSSKCNCDKVLKTKSYPSKHNNEDNVSPYDIKKDSNKCYIQFVNQDLESTKHPGEAKHVSDCNYNIKLLGVTLADVNSNKQHIGFSMGKDETEPTSKTFNGYRSTNSPLINECGCLVNPNFIKSTKTGGEGETISVCCVAEQNNKNTRDQPYTKCFDKMSSCECKTKFTEFKNYIDIALQQECVNDDKSLDAQSFNLPITEEEKCVCCISTYGDESKELEENAFHLLEEHLKQKLEEFKETSYESSCIPPEEEEKIFSTILKRVKKVISESTNKISCKCSGKGGDGQGSWSRAYGLLQEYLKMKIKRVQCSCVLVEDNKDTILPDVLDKVSNLIESDFKRLKDICGCQRKKDITKKDRSKFNFSGEAPEKDVNIDVEPMMDKLNSRRPLHQQNVLLQVSDYFGLDAKSCDPMDQSIKKYHGSQDVQSFQSLNDEQECNCTRNEIDSEILTRNRTIKPETLHNDKNETKKILVTDEQSKITVSSKRDRCLSAPCIRFTNNCSCNVSKAKIRRVNETTNTSKGTIIKNDHCTRDNNNITVLGKSQHSEAKSKHHIYDSAEHECYQKQCDQNKNVGGNNSLKKLPNSPYIGYTIECSCQNKLGKCVCSRATFKPNEEIVNNMWNNSLQNKNFSDKVAYILNNTNDKNNDEKKECFATMKDNLLLQNNKVSKQHDINNKKYDCDSEINAIVEEVLVLRDSIERFDTVNTTTNTYDDNNSINTDYSINEESLDWCECCSQIKSHKHSPFKKSIYHTAPLHNNHSNPSKSASNISFGSDIRHVKQCNCDMVPICHVKMLVENIENKLASSKCTCDSLIPKVCPVHTK